jgi:NADPH:quinone reductase-like Zn-dependent oxidoreductase
VYGFALPSLPSVNGREFIGKVVEVNKKNPSTYAVGDMVSQLSSTCYHQRTDGVKILSVSTDYRDLRKSAFQEYAVVSQYNAVKLPQSYRGYHTASIGVAFITAAIALGVTLGMVFPKAANGSALNLLKVAQAQEPSNVPADISDEIFNSIDPRSRPRNGDWIMIYGGSNFPLTSARLLSKVTNG